MAPPRKNQICSYCGSTTEVWKFKDVGCFCKRHYQEMYRHGEVRDVGRRKKNKFVVKDEIVEIHFDKGEIALIDREDLEKVQQLYWGLTAQGYIHSKFEGRMVRLHLYLLDFPDSIVDHINRNKLDNRKCNLRLCTHKENSRNRKILKRNTSGFTGVYFDKPSGKWRARIKVGRKNIHLGYFEKFEDAIEARKFGELKYFGDFAPNVDAEFRERAVTKIRG